MDPFAPRPPCWIRCAPEGCRLHANCDLTRVPCAQNAPTGWRGLYLPRIGAAAEALHAATQNWRDAPTPCDEAARVAAEAYQRLAHAYAHGTSEIVVPRDVRSKTLYGAGLAAASGAKVNL